MAEGALLLSLVAKYKVRTKPSDGQLGSFCVQLRGWKTASAVSQ